MIENYFLKVRLPFFSLEMKFTSLAILVVSISTATITRFDRESPFNYKYTVHTFEVEEKP
jgi:hypothetical protein